MNDLIRANLKEIVELQGIIKKDDLNYKPKQGKTYFVLAFFFKRYTRRTFVISKKN